MTPPVSIVERQGANGPVPDDYKLDHAITATQKPILEAFEIDDVDVKARALAIGKCTHICSEEPVLVGLLHQNGVNFHTFECLTPRVFT